MSVSYDASVVLGVLLSEISTEETVTREEPRFHPKTGKPVAPEQVTETTYTLLGKPWAEEDGAPGPDGVYYALFKPAGLEVFGINHEVGDERDDHVIGRALFAVGRDDFNSIEDMTLAELPELAADIKQRLVGLGADPAIEIKLYFVTYCG